MGTAGKPEFGGGALSRATNTVYWMLSVSLLLVLANLPLALAAVFLVPVPSNLPLLALAAVPLGPSLAAACFCVSRSLSGKESTPVAFFLRGYRNSLRDVLALWSALMALLAVVGLDLLWLAGDASASGFQGLMRPLVLGVGIAGLLWGANLVLIGSAFSFRRRDLARLAAYALVRSPLTTLGNALLLLVAGVLVGSGLEAAVPFLSSFFILAALAYARPMLEHIRRHHIKADEPDLPLPAAGTPAAAASQQ